MRAKKVCYADYLICLILVYAGLGIFVWFNHKTREIKDYPLKAELAVLGAALTMHGAVLLMPVIQDKILIMGFGYSISLIVWLMLLVYFVGSFSIVCADCSCFYIRVQRLPYYWARCFQENMSVTKSMICRLCRTLVHRCWHTVYSAL